jgi:hypothetical protein
MSEATTAEPRRYAVGCSLDQGVRPLHRRLPRDGNPARKTETWPSLGALARALSKAPFGFVWRCLMPRAFRRRRLFRSLSRARVEKRTLSGGWSVHRRNSCLFASSSLLWARRQRSVSSRSSNPKPRANDRRSCCSLCCIRVEVGATGTFGIVSFALCMERATGWAKGPNGPNETRFGAVAGGNPPSPATLLFKRRLGFSAPNG